MNTNYTKFVILKSDVAGVWPTVPYVSNHKMAGWIPETDIYEGELFLNTADMKVFTRAGSTIIQIAGTTASGSSGTSGTSGASGASGASGTSGTSGVDGTFFGSSGTSGSSGSSGVSGSSGSSGVSGSSGSSGTSGVSGSSGSSGVSGSSGSSGVSGSSGSSGVSGSSGSSGTSGSSGSSAATFFDVYVTNATVISNLTTTTNWTNGGTYSGTAITGTYQGQKYYAGKYFYEAVADNTWVRSDLSSISKTYNLIAATTSAVYGGFYACDCTTYSIAVNLPTAASTLNSEIVVKKIDSTVNTVTIDGNASETIDGALTYVLGAQYDFVKLISNGANWWIIS